MKHGWLKLAALLLLVGVVGGYLIQDAQKESPEPLPTLLESTNVAIQATPPDTHSGPVAATTNSGGYTYVMIKAGNEDVWAAAPAQTITIGEPVTFSKAMPMHNFHSPSLNRTFDTIYFVSSLKEGAGASGTGLPPGHPPIQSEGSANDASDPHGSAHGTTEDGAAAARIYGVVLETMDAGSYTYVNVKQDGEEEPFWAAASKVALSPGQRIAFPQGRIMPTFSSPTLNRTFTNIHFVTEISLAQDASAQEAVPAEPGARQDLLTEAPAGDVVPLDALFENKAEWQDKDILVQGSVTKCTPKILGKNWVHLADATGKTVVFTTAAEVRLDQKLMVKGRVTLDKDIGAGYVYDVLLEDCKIFPAQ